MNLAVEHGYAVENHTVRTADGYLLGVFRLPNPGKPPVLLAHGMLSSSADFLTLGKGRALGECRCPGRRTPCRPCRA